MDTYPFEGPFTSLEESLVVVVGRIFSATFFFILPGFPFSEALLLVMLGLTFSEKFSSLMFL